MPMTDQKVFCIGLSRTGTTSLHHLFGVMDQKTIHYSTYLFANPQLIDSSLHFKPKLKRNFIRNLEFKQELKQLTEQDHADLLINNKFFSDHPFPLFYKNLDVKFPNSKFIYTYRSEDRWLKSMKWMLTTGRVLWNWRGIDDELLFQAYGTHRYDKNKLLSAYRHFHNDVMKYFEGREDDLLVINIDREGVPMERLSNFLDMDLPASLPHNNTNKSRDISLLKKITYNLRKIPFSSFVIDNVRK